MKLKNIFKRFSAVLAAAVCCAAMSSPVSAASTSQIWKDTKKEAGAFYNAKYIQLAEKYHEKEAKNTITYGKSRTKKVVDKLVAVYSKKTPQFKITLATSDEIMAGAIKGNYKLKTVMYSDETSMGIYVKNNTVVITANTADGKLKITEKLSNDDYKEAFDESVGTLNDFSADFKDADNNLKGKYFKFKYDDKIFYYEEFETADGTEGVLFTEKGTPVVMVSDDMACCVKISYKVDDSEFDAPKGYKEAE